MFYAKRAKADGQYAHRQTDQDGLGAAGGRRPTRAVRLGPVYAGRPEALQQGATQVFWGEIKYRDTEGLGWVALPSAGCTWWLTSTPGEPWAPCTLLAADIRRPHN